MGLKSEITTTQPLQEGLWHAVQRKMEQPAAARKKIIAGPVPRVILCVGLKSSGSTWLYNVVIQLLKVKMRGGVMAFYADNLAMFPADTERARVLVIKAHEPSKALVYLMRLTRGRMFLSVRELRDAIASLMQRFGHAFEGALRETARQSVRIAELAHGEDTITYRYERGFYDRSKTIGEIAAALGIRANKATRERIFRSLTREAVKKKIDGLKQKGKFGARPNADSFDPNTHWHPGHIGDGRIGKHAAVLSKKQQTQVLARTREYCGHFGYLRMRKR